MNKNIFILVMTDVMKDFASKEDIEEEYEFLSTAYGDGCQQIMLNNIRDWLRQNFSCTDKEDIIWDRLEYYGL